MTQKLVFLRPRHLFSQKDGRRLCFAERATKGSPLPRVPILQEKQKAKTKKLLPASCQPSSARRRTPCEVDERCEKPSSFARREKRRERKKERRGKKTQRETRRRRRRRRRRLEGEGKKEEKTQKRGSARRGSLSKAEERREKKDDAADASISTSRVHFV